MPVDGVTPDAIGLGFVPRPGLLVEAMPVGSEMVLVDSGSGMVHALDPVAALVWQCFDGRSTLEEIAVDLAEGFDAPFEVVSQDLLGMVRKAGCAGLLQGVAEDRSSRPSGPPNGLAMGTRVTLPEPLHKQAGKAKLVVNWSARCGFCLRVLPELARLQTSLDGAGIDIVFVDAATADDTDRLLADYSIKAAVAAEAVTEGDSSPAFQGLGTPIAYMLDEEHLIASPLAYGADEVLALARRAAGVPSPTASRDEEADQPGALPPAVGLCGPTSSGPVSQGLQPTHAYAVGEVRVGIRADSRDAERILSLALRDYRLPDVVAVPERFSVVLPLEEAGGRRDLARLTSGSSTMARSRSSVRVLRALAGHLSCLLDPEPGLCRLDAIAAVVHGQGLLLPKSLVTRHLAQLQAPLARMGLEVMDEPFAHVDLLSSELVVANPRIRLDEEVLSALPDPAPGVSEPVPPPDGRYPLRGWLMPAGTSLSRAGAVSSALSMLVAHPEKVAENIGSFASLVEQIEIVEIVPDDVRSLTQSLRDWVNSCSGS